MSSLLDLINEQLTPAHVEALGAQIGAPPAETKSAIDQSLPLLLGAVSQRANSSTSLNFLTSLLDKNHDGSVLDDILRMVVGGEASSVQNKAALKTILGSQMPKVENRIASNSGLDANSVAKLLPLLAPIVLGALTKAQTSGNLQGRKLNDLLEKESTSIATNSPESFSFMSALLTEEDQPGMIDDIIRAGKRMFGQGVSNKP